MASVDLAAVGLVVVVPEEDFNPTETGGRMQTSEVLKKSVLRRMIQNLTDDLGAQLRSIVLYGSAARGDFQKKSSDFNLLIVLESLGPNSLESLAPSLKRWRRHGQPTPRLFSLSLIAESADVFPIEFLDLQSNRIVLYGEDPFAALEIHNRHLRLQCERELREKMMRLREGYIEAHSSNRSLRHLFTDSYSTFVALFRGCLYLHGDQVPLHSEDVVTKFCARAELNPIVFREVQRLKNGESVSSDLRSLFSDYYTELTKAVLRVDHFEMKSGG